MITSDESDRMNGYANALEFLFRELDDLRLPSGAQVRSLGIGKGAAGIALYACVRTDAGRLEWYDVKVRPTSRTTAEIEPLMEDVRWQAPEGQRIVWCVDIGDFLGLGFI